MKKITGETLDITKENFKIISEYFPEAMTEGKIDFDKLKELLGEFIDESNERYQFTWNGKSQALKLSQTPSTGTLRPCKEKSKDWDTTENIYIEGDNLEVLKLLQKSYNRKVKMIYIDPPYNTETDLIYKDSFKDNIKNYKDATNQKHKANPDVVGRYHTNWLNMMYPRLRLAKNLLKEDGTIFISIDDKEMTNTIKMCHEIFGEENFITAIPRISSYQRSGQELYMNISHDYLLVYSFDYDFKNVTERILRKDKVKKDKNGTYIEGDTKAIVAAQSQGYSAGGDYDFEYNGKVYSPVDSKGNRNRWLWTKPRMEAAAKLGILVETKNTLRMQLYLDKKFKEGLNILVDKDDKLKFHTADFMTSKFDNPLGTKELKELFDGKEYFDNPKPTNLINYLINLCTDSNDVIMDFFSGSATTAHSCMKINALNEKKNNKFILVQLPEEINQDEIAYKDRYNTLCDIGEERIRRAGEKIKLETNADIDYGFKVFKLDSSNLKLWNGDFNTEEEAKNYFIEHLNPLVEDRTNEDLLYELLLKEGLSLTSPIEEIKVEDKTIYSIGMGYLMICLEDKIDMNVVEEIGKRKPESIIFRDSGFENENVKINTIQELKKYGIPEEVIKSI